MKWHYSGYITINTSSPTQYHYYLILSEGSPKHDPLTLWLNGGPGSSSLLGLFTEIGQVMTNDDSLSNLDADGVPTLAYNPYGWTTVASVLFLEMPAGVGFSYCDNPDDCSYTDERTADEAVMFLKAFFEFYPEFRTSQFFITGESYAGVYIPMIAERLLALNSSSINLQGIAIGNGCIGNVLGACADGYGDTFRLATHFYHQHAMLSEDLISRIHATCNWDALSVPCLELVKEMHVQLGHFNRYNVYDTCGKDTSPDPGLALQGSAGLLDYWEVAPGLPAVLRKKQLLRGMNDYACGGERAMKVYLKHPKVVAALHVIANTSGMQYNRTVRDLRPLMAKLATQLRVAIYSGDVDSDVPTISSLEWLQSLLDAGSLKEVAPWRPWRSLSSSGQYVRAGYHVVYQPNNFTFATFAGSGHMVPTYKPVEALAFFTRWTAGLDLDQPLPPSPPPPPSSHRSMETGRLQHSSTTERQTA